MADFSFRKLRNDKGWGVAGPADAELGSTVLAQNSKGDENEVVLARRITTFDDGKALYSIVVSAGAEKREKTWWEQEKHIRWAICDCFRAVALCLERNDPKNAARFLKEFADMYGGSDAPQNGN